MKHLLGFLLLATFLPALANGPRLGLLSYKTKNLVPSHLSSFSGIKEDDKKERFWDRVRFGGNIGLQFGTTTNILISPSIGYIPKAKFLNDRLMVGIGVTYMYYRLKLTTGNLESNIYGGRVFGRYLITNNIFAYVEDEMLNADDYYQNSIRRWVNSVFVGGGYLLRFSERSGIMISLLYNLSWTAIHPIYSSPWNVRIGFVL